MIKKILLISHDNYGAREMFTAMTDAHKDLEFMVFSTTGLYYKKTFVQSIIKMLKEASIIFCFHRFVDLFKYKLAKDNMCTRAKAKGIPVHYISDVNSPSSQNLIKEFAPDIMIASFTMHILNNETVGLSRIATLGCHPSILPDYRGLEVFFWALANGEKLSGVSVFYMNERIDYGCVISQELFIIDQDETVRSIYIKLTRISSRLLVEVLQKYKKGQKFTEKIVKGKGRYFPMPTRESYRKFMKLGRKWK